MIHVLGIDAGGTKTVCQLADTNGTLIVEARAGGANLQAAGELQVEKVLHDVMAEAIGPRNIIPAAICLGIAGVDRPEDFLVVEGIMRRIGAHARTIVVNDALVALEAEAPGAPGVVIISGTGSIAYGRNAQNEGARAGGWGHVLGDEGSGFWIGRAALRAIFAPCFAPCFAACLAGNVTQQLVVQLRPQQLRSSRWRPGVPMPAESGRNRPRIRGYDSER